jgi:transcriptional regulator with XRE-family HTH domain
VRKLRYRRRWSQITFATKLQHCGWNVSRETVAKIESRSRMVLDVQVLYLAEVLEVQVGALFPRTPFGDGQSKECSIAKIFTFQSNFVPHAEQAFPKSMQ